MRLIVFLLACTAANANEWTLRARSDAFGWEPDKQLLRPSGNEITVFRRRADDWDAVAAPLRFDGATIRAAALSHDGEALAVLAAEGAAKRIHVYRAEEGAWTLRGEPVNADAWGSSDSLALNGDGTSVAHLLSRNDTFKVYAYAFRDRWRAKGRPKHNKGAIRLHSVHLHQNGSSIIIDSHAIHRTLVFREGMWIYRNEDVNHTRFATDKHPSYKLITRSLQGHDWRLALAVVPFALWFACVRAPRNRHGKTHLP